uniref:dynein axonemal intermediate chain 2-like n=1 Tax=Myxine glutinosa TaxID=7769 RepID=UPI00358E7F12
MEKHRKSLNKQQQLTAGSMEMSYASTKKRSEFGRQCMFTERASELLVDLLPDPKLAKNFVGKKFQDAATQCAPMMAEHEVNTTKRKMESRGMNHLEGGWPKDVDPLDGEQKIKFQNKVERDEDYRNTIVNIGNALEHCIKQNNTLCLDNIYFEGEEELSFDDVYPSTKTINVFRDPNDIKRTACHLSWSPDGSDKLAVAYSKLGIQGTPFEMSLDSYIWDIENPLIPEMSLKPASALLCLEFNPKDSQTLVGGCYNGQLAYWDTRNGSRPVDTTPIEQSHREPAFKVIWNQSKSNTECFSASYDGQVLWWDVRKLNEPVDTLVLDMSKKGNLENALRAVSLAYAPTMPSNFMVGTEEGLVVAGNRNAKTQAEKLVRTYAAHHGPVYALQRNFFDPKMFLTVGDWRACVWNENFHQSAVMSTEYQPSYLTDGCWSPSRPYVFFICKMDGTLDIWDFMNKHNGPTLTMQIYDEPLFRLRVQDNGQFLACGSHLGTITLLEVSSGLYTLQHNEKKTISAMFAQQTRRAQILTTKYKRRRLKEKNQPLQDKEYGQRMEDLAQRQEAMIIKAEKEFFEITKLEVRKIENKVSNGDSIEKV